MKHLLVRVLTAVAVASIVALPAPSPAASTYKASLNDYCGSFQQSSDGHTVSTVCNTPGTKYYFQAYVCGTSSCQWISSNWTTDNTRATIRTSGYVSGIGSTIYYYK
jgi:hypothetical protein